MRTIQSHLSYYWLLYLYGIFFSLNALATSYVAAFTGKNWSTLTWTDISLTGAAMLANWTGTMMAFFSKTFARLSEGRPPIIPAGDTTPPFKPDPQPPQPKP